MVFGSSCNYSVNLCYVEGAQDLLPRGPTLAGPSEVVCSPRIRPVRGGVGVEQNRSIVLGMGHYREKAHSRLRSLLLFRSQYS